MPPKKRKATAPPATGHSSPIAKRTRSSKASAHAAPPTSSATKTTITKKKGSKKISTAISISKAKGKGKGFKATPPVLGEGELDAVGEVLVKSLKPKPKEYKLATGEDGELLDASLAQVDISQNTDKYYIIQLIDVNNTEKYYLFTRWGRTGTSGQNRLDGPYEDLEIGEKEFNKKFLEKTGNNWSERASFTSFKGKYDLLTLDYTKKQIGTWEYYIDDHIDGKANGWHAYAKEGEEDVEKLWDTFQFNKTYNKRIIQSGTFSYLVDLVQMTQTNTGSKRVRHIRRSHNGVITASKNAPGAASS